jgi:hypothetical protein
MREAADGDRRRFRPGAFRSRGSGADPISGSIAGVSGPSTFLGPDTFVTGLSFVSRHTSANFTAG